MAANGPCARIKAKFADQKFKEKVAAIDKPEVFDYDHEMGFAAGYPPPNTGVTGTQYQPMENKIGSHSVSLPDGDHYLGLYILTTMKVMADTLLKYFLLQI